MTDDIVARLREMPKSLDDAMRKMDNAADTIEAERAAWVKAENEPRGDWASQRENDHLTIKFYEMKERAEAAEARVRELEALVRTLKMALEDATLGITAATNEAEIRADERAEAYERAAEVADRPVIGFSDGAVEAARYIAAAIRKLAQEVKHEAE